MERRDINSAAIGCLLNPCLLLVLYVAGYFCLCGTGPISQGDVPIGLTRFYRLPGAGVIYEPAGVVEEWLTGKWIIVIELPPRDKTSTSTPVIECNH